MNKERPNLCENETMCSGCSACTAVCPVNAISLEYNCEGFLYPKVDKGSCIGCLKCEHVCAFKKDVINSIDEKKNTHIYAAKAKDKSVLYNSSSGGMFTVLSDLFLENGDAIVSCVYSDENDAVEFSFIDSKSKRDEARGSKYIQAEIGNSFARIVDWLIEHPEKNMLVVGTGCQIAGIDLVLKEKKLRDRVLLVDLICHGAASSRLWKDYIYKIKSKMGDNLTYITFKNKKNGWENPSAFVKIQDKEVSIKPYVDWFYMGWILRESCYNCPYTKIDRNSDITIGDFWGIQNSIPEFYDTQGVSLVITHNSEGERIFSKLKSVIDFCESDRESCLQPRLLFPEKRPKDRDLFWKDMNQKGLEYCEVKYYEYHKKTLKEKLKIIIKKLLRK